MSASEVRYNSRGRRINSLPHDQKVFAQDWQKKILMKQFQVDQFPDRRRRDELEKELGLSQKWLNSWFITKRKITRKQANKSINNSSTEEINISKDVMNESLDVLKNEDDTADDVKMLDEEQSRPDDDTDKLETLQRKFDELQARYEVMSQLLIKRSIIKQDDVEKLKTDDKMLEKLTTDDETLSESVAVEDALKTEEDVKPGLSSSDPSQQQQPQYHYPYHYPHYYPPPHWK